MKPTHTRTIKLIDCRLRNYCRWVLFYQTPSIDQSTLALDRRYSRQICLLREISIFQILFYRLDLTHQWSYLLRKTSFSSNMTFVKIRLSQNLDQKFFEWKLKKQKHDWKKSFLSIPTKKEEKMGKRVKQWFWNQADQNVELQHLQLRLRHRTGARELLLDHGLCVS